jgi:hypothetical protein
MWYNLHSFYILTRKGKDGFLGRYAALRGKHRVYAGSEERKDHRTVRHGDTLGAHEGTKLLRCIKVLHEDHSDCDISLALLGCFRLCHFKVPLSNSRC